MRKYLQIPFHCRTHPKTQPSLPPSQGKKPQLFHKERTMVLLRAELPSAQFKGLYVTEYPFSTLTFNTKCIILSRGLGAVRSLLKPPLVEYLRKKTKRHRHHYRTRGIQSYCRKEDKKNKSKLL